MAEQEKELNITTEVSFDFNDNKSVFFAVFFKETSYYFA